MVRRSDGVDVDDLRSGDDLGQAGGTDTTDRSEIPRAIPRIDVGVGGLDRMVRGGFPERSLIGVIGDSGTGKTTLGLEFLHEGLRSGNRAVLVTTEQTSYSVVDGADEMGFEFSTYVDENELAIIDVHPMEVKRAIETVRRELPVIVDEFGARRLVLDSLSILEKMYDDDAVRESEVYELIRSLKRTGVNALVTSRTAQDSHQRSKFGLIEGLSDVLFVLQFSRSDADRNDLVLDVRKARNTLHSRDAVPYEITDSGIEVVRPRQRTFDGRLTWG